MMVVGRGTWFDGCGTPSFPHVITVHPAATNTLYNEQTYGVPYEVAAYIPPVVSLDHRGEMRSDGHPTTAIIDSLLITKEDKLVLPDGSSPTITSLERWDFVDGFDHTVVTFA